MVTSRNTFRAACIHHLQRDPAPALQAAVVVDEIAVGALELDAVEACHGSCDSWYLISGTGSSERARAGGRGMMMAHEESRGEHMFDPRGSALRLRHLAS